MGTEGRLLVSDAVKTPMPRAERGRLGARARWGQQRTVRLTDLDPRVQAAILALVAADKAATPPDDNR